MMHLLNCLLLQNREMTLPDADRAIKCTVQVLESMSSSPGPYAAETNSAVEAKVFKEIQLHSNSKVVEIHSGQFFRSLAENLRQRLVQNASQASQLGLSGAKGTGKVKLLLEDLKIVCTKNWPPETNYPW
jgi:hypothetical protein